MNLLLDAKDLIELLERSQPMSPAAFRDWMIARNARVVLTYTNVSEFANCFRGVSDILYIRSIVQALEALPVIYLREATIQAEELKLAIHAFDAGVEPSRPNPYVARWDHTFAKYGEAPPAEMLVGYRLDLMVFDLLKNIEARRTPITDAALNAIRADRAIPKASRPKPRQALTANVEKYMSFWRLTPPKRPVEDFGKWLYSDPARCPGFRLATELFWALVANEQDIVRDSDVWDNAHFPAIPYVDYATLDRRMTGYCREITLRLRRQNAAIDYGDRCFRTLAELVVALT
jgi:hypothetical protein